VTSGTVVLRHELGHTVGRVGEEYDGGGYFGANNTTSATNPSWRHWLTPASPSIEPIVAHHIAWPWQYLPNGPYRLSWTSPSNMSSYHISFSASGIETDQSIKLALDGEQLPFIAPGHIDRDFHNIIHQEGGFGAGRHELVVSNGEQAGDHWLSSIQVFEFGEGINLDNSHVNLYPVFTRPGSRAGFRPTFEGCLMRDMKNEFFCVVCQENNWLQFFSKVGVIDSFESVVIGDQRVLTVKTPQLAQFREGGPIGNELMQIRWSKNGTALPEYNDLAEVSVAAGDATGTWKVDVTYKTDEVRKDSNGRLSASKTLRL